MFTVTVGLRRVGEQQHAQAVVEPVLGDALDRRDARHAGRQRSVACGAAAREAGVCAGRCAGCGCAWACASPAIERDRSSAAVRVRREVMGRPAIEVPGGQYHTSRARRGTSAYAPGRVDGSKRRAAERVEDVGSYLTIRKYSAPIPFTSLVPV